jgi:hypothetical protein
MLNEFKAHECQTKLQQLQWKEQGKMLRDEVEDGLNIMGIKTQASNGQKMSGIEEDYFGSQGTQRTVVLGGWGRKRRRRIYVSSTYFLTPGLPAIIRLRIFCLPVCFPKLKRSKYTELSHYIHRAFCLI